MGAEAPCLRVGEQFIVRSSTKVGDIGSDLGVMYPNRNDAVEDEEDTSTRHLEKSQGPACISSWATRQPATEGDTWGIRGQGQHV